MKRGDEREAECVGAVLLDHIQRVNDVPPSSEWRLAKKHVILIVLVSTVSAILRAAEHPFSTTRLTEASYEGFRVLCKKACSEARTVFRAYAFSGGAHYVSEMAMADNTTRNVFFVKMAVIGCGLVLELGEIAMILMDIQSQGSIAIKSPIFEGSVNATYIGLLIIFIGMALQSFAILRRYRFKTGPKSLKTPNCEYHDGESYGEEEK